MQKMELNMKYSKVDSSTVKYIASLAKIGITDEEIKEFHHQFTSILEEFTLLNDIKTDNLVSIIDSQESNNQLRADEIKPSMSRAEFLLNVPRHNGEYVITGAILDKGETRESL